MKSNNLKIYCITHKYLKFLENLNLNFIVGGSYFNKNKFPNNWLSDNTNKNISKKNKNFETLTSIYWIWKNELPKIKKNQWIGICHYRRFWLKSKHQKKINVKNLKLNLLRSIPQKNSKYDAFVVSPQNLTGYKMMKILKKGKKNILRNPLILFNKKYHNINLHFNMFHIYDGLNKAAALLKKKDRNDFLKYINTETSYYPFSIFILKKEKFNQMCIDTFNWIFKCEKLFDKNQLHGYGQVKLFAFLAERYFSFWIKKNTKHKIISGIYFDTEKKVAKFI